MKKILTVETVKDIDKVNKKLEELKAYVYTEKGFAEYEKALSKLWEQKFSNSDENSEIAALLLADWLGFDELKNDETYALFGKKMAQFMIEVLNLVSTEKAREILKEKIMAE